MNAPEHVITLEETLELAARAHAGKPQLALALRLIRNTGVRKRHLVQPIEQTLHHPGFEARNRIYEIESKKPSVSARTPGRYPSPNWPVRQAERPSTALTTSASPTPAATS